MNDDEAKAELCDSIDDFIRENIDLSAKAIAIKTNEKIKDGDVLLTYGW